MKRYTVNSRNYDWTIRRSWECDLVEVNKEYIDLIGEFAESIEHPALGRIEKGTVSRERFYLNRWHNYFIFEHPANTRRNVYINICMPPKIGDGVIDYVDLDIDVIVWPDGRQMTLDLEEFYVNCSAFEYPDDVKNRALEELKTVQALSDSFEPADFAF